MKYKRIILIFSIFILFSIASVSAGEVDDKVMMSDENPEIESTSIEKDLKTTEDNQLLSKANDDEIQSVKDNEIIGEDIDSNTNATFDDLKKEIGKGGNIILKHKFYNYNGTGQESEHIDISIANSIIDGNGAVINMNGSHTQVFQIVSSNITIKNLTIINGNFDPSWSWYFIYVVDSGAKIINCNFIDNNGHTKGVIFFEENINGAVTNCTFINNIAGTDSWGGAIFNTNGNVAVTNCYFSGNYAGEGSDIYSEAYSVTADTCIFTDTGTTYNVQIVPPTLNVDDFITVNNSGEKLTLDLKTNSGMSVDNGNISISVYNKNNDILVGESRCLSGEGWAVDLPVGSYYAAFNTEYAGFEAINRTITVIPNTEYYINVTPVTTDNKTVTISAKSNIPTDTIGGRLVFILPNGDEINGTYNSNDTWWAVHTFDKYGTYEINATYTNFKIMTVHNTTITIEKANSTIHLDDIILDYPESETVTVATEGATGITAKIDGKNVSVVDNFTIQISDLDAGSYTLAVTTIPDETHLSVTKTANITVNKVDTKIGANDLELAFGDKTKLVYVLMPEYAEGNITFSSSNPGVANVSTLGEVTAVSVGTANVTITFEGNKNYEKTTKTIKVKVDMANSTVNIGSSVLDYGNSLNVTVDATGAKGITAKIDGKDAKVNGYTIEIPVLNAGSHTLTVTTIPEENYNPITKTASITVNKLKTTLNTKSIATVYTVNKNLVITLKDSKGNALNGVNITVQLKDAKTYTTNKNGQIKVPTKGLIPKTYTAKITFKGNTNYEKTSKNTVKVTVKKATPKITAKKKTFKRTVKTKKYNIALKTNLKKAMKGVKVTLKVNKKTYSAKTNKKGIATFKITKLTKTGKYTATVKFAGNKYYNAKAVKQKIIVK